MAWTAEPSLPTPSLGLAVAVCGAPPGGSGQWIYAIGGTNNNVLGTISGYDTVHKHWSAQPSMPTARGALAAATTAGRIHVVGGFAVSEPLTTHEVYEPANQTWSTAAPLPSVRATHAAVTGPDGLIYAIGGFDGNNFLATVDAYDPVADKWTSKAPLHAARSWHKAVVGQNGLIYAIGGGTPGALLSSVETFNVTTNTWTTSPFPLPTATCGLGAAVDPNGLICVAGGNTLSGNTSVVTNSVYLFNPASPGWITQPALSSARYGLAAGTGQDGLVYAIGGTDGSNNAVATVEAYTTDKCYPIEQKIAAVESELSGLQGGVGDLPPQAQAGARKQIIALGLELRGLETQLKTCRGG
jgi:hypothetical protein